MKCNNILLYCWSFLDALYKPVSHWESLKWSNTELSSIDELNMPSANTWHLICHSLGVRKTWPRMLDRGNDEHCIWNIPIYNNIKHIHGLIFKAMLENFWKVHFELCLCLYMEMRTITISISPLFIFYPYLACSLFLLTGHLWSGRRYM